MQGGLTAGAFLTGGQQEINKFEMEERTPSESLIIHNNSSLAQVGAL